VSHGALASAPLFTGLGIQEERFIAYNIGTYFAQTESSYLVLASKIGGFFLQTIEFDVTA
jgi:hypothetical protein